MLSGVCGFAMIRNPRYKFRLAALDSYIGAFRLINAGNKTSIADLSGYELNNPDGADAVSNLPYALASNKDDTVAGTVDAGANTLAERGTPMAVV